MTLVEQCEKRWQESKFMFQYTFDPEPWQHEVRVFAHHKRSKTNTQIACGFGATKQGAYAMADTGVDDHFADANESGKGDPREG